MTTIFMLVYGDYHKLHRATLEAFMRQKYSNARVRLWLNVVCLETLDWLLTVVPKDWLLYISSENVPKYKVMWKLFNDPVNPIETPWITWFDDDIVTTPEWFSGALGFIAGDPHISFFGAQFWRPHSSGVKHWLKTARWYKRQPFSAYQGTNGIWFIRGSYWWLETAVMRQLDWPDPRLVHNGGDTALSEAILQLKLKQREYYLGTSTDFAPRRGRSDRPAGCKSGKRASDGKAPRMVNRMVEYDALLARHNISYVSLTDSVRLVGDISNCPAVELMTWGIRPATPSASILGLPTVQTSVQSRRKAPADGATRRFIKVPPRAPKRRQVYAQAEVKPKSGVSVPPRRASERTLKQLLQIRQQKQQRR